MRKMKIIFKNMLFIINTGAIISAIIELFYFQNYKNTQKVVQLRKSKKYKNRI